ncbi:MAG: hypothetical protein EOO43_26560 [Flavobacterium sp.]|nr:MAG: hypothetical protein EOO43_26560 [Flavobacterium sp.]
MKKNLYLVALLSIAVSLHSCKKAIEVTDPENEITGTKAAPDGFAYNTTQDLELNIRLLKILLNLL